MTTDRTITVQLTPAQVSFLLACIGITGTTVPATAENGATIRKVLNDAEDAFWEAR